MLIDSHCHLPHNLEETERIIKEANEAGVKKFINIGTNLKESKKAIVAAQSLDNVHATVGVYPHEEKTVATEELATKLDTLINANKKHVVGIGECGIDINKEHKQTPIKRQKELFEMQAQLALKHNLPVIVHNRNGDEHILELLNKYPGLKGVLHCFASTWSFAQKVLEHDFYISFSGLITYPSRKDLLETAKNTPLNRTLVETDSPYLPPQGHRGETNYPKYVRIVAQKLAETRKTSLETVSQVTCQNTKNIFNLW